MMVMDRKQRAELAQRIIARFRELKDDEGLTQEQLADLAGVKIRTLSDILRGVSVPNDQTARKIGAAMGIEMTPGEQRHKWAKYESFFDILGVYLDARPESEHEAIMRRVFSALPPETPDITPE